MKKFLFFFSVIFALIAIHLVADPKLIKKNLKVMIHQIQTHFQNVRHLTIDEARQLKSPIILDVRSKKERNISVIPNSQSLDSSQVLDPKKPVLVYCTIGYRSSLHVQKLTKQGYDAFNLEGGILSWAHAGGNLLTTEGKPTKMVHTYGPLWNLLPEGYQGVH